MIFQECIDCVATHFCPVKPEFGWAWCKARYRLYAALKLSRIPQRYLDANAYNAIRDNDNKQAYVILDPYFNNIIQAVDEGINFWLHGSQVGTGKTYTAIALLNHFIYKTCLSDRFDFETPLGLYTSYPALVDDLRYRRDSDEVILLMNHIKSTPLLLLDDIGSGTITDFVVEQTYLIVNHRVDNRLSTIITTNFKPSELVASLGERLVSRLKDNAVNIKFTGTDRRVRRG